MTKSVYFFPRGGDLYNNEKHHFQLVTDYVVCHVAWSELWRHGPHFDRFLLWYKGTLSVLLAYHCIIQYKVYYVKNIFGTLYCIIVHCII